MKIITLCIGNFNTNCYLIIKNNKCLIVDPGADYDIIRENIKGLNVLGVLITHYHPDHIGALDELLKDYPVKIYDYKMKNRNVLIESFSFDIIYNPGHKNDAVSFIFPKEKRMFCGDFIFKDTIGRTDLEEGNFNLMQESISMIKKYFDDIIIYPGHGPITELGYEKKNNPYFKNI